MGLCTQCLRPGRFEGGSLTYEGQVAGRSNRVLILLVVITILLVAYWAINGGLDEIGITSGDPVVVTD